MLVYVSKTMFFPQVRKRDFISIIFLLIFIVVLSHNERFKKSIFYETFPRNQNNIENSNFMKFLFQETFSRTK